MNRLQIAQLINTLAGTQGVIDSTENSTGYQTVLISLMDTGYAEIQNFREQWKFMKRHIQVPVNTTTYEIAFPTVKLIEKLIYDQVELKEIAYSNWILTDHTTGPPAEWSWNDTGDILLVNPPDTSYIIDLYYWQNPDVMTLNADIPVLPLSYHNLLVYKTLIGLGSYLGNFDLINEYTFQYESMMGQMMRTELEGKRVKTLAWVI